VQRVRLGRRLPHPLEKKTLRAPRPFRSNRGAFFPDRYFQMRLKETILLALKLSHKEQRDLVVGFDGARWQIMPLDDARSDLLQHSFILTPEGLRYPDDPDRLRELVAEGY
jgi:hypothetical protein